MNRHDNTYSQLVTAAKVLLPLAAIGLLSTLFLLARTAPQGEPIRFAEDSVNDLASAQRLNAPVHASVTQDGTEVRIVAEAFSPDPERPSVTLGTDLAARLLTQDGLVYDITALTGELDEINALSTLSNDVQIVASNGYRVETNALQLRTDLTHLESLAPVHADGPLGELDAGRMEIFTDPDDDTQTRVVFTQGVRLLYIPQKR